MIPNLQVFITPAIDDDERKVGLKYTDYVDLLDFERENAYNDYFDEAIRFTSSDDWKEEFFSLETLRRINKFKPEVIEDRILEMFKFIHGCINSPRSALNKNALVLVQEIFMTPRSEKLTQFAVKIAPLLQVKTGYEYKMVRREAWFALQYISGSVPYPKVIDALCSGCESKNLKIKGCSWKSVADSVYNMSPDHYVTPENFKHLFNTLEKGLITPKSLEEKHTKQILKFIGKPKCDSI